MERLYPFEYVRTRLFDPCCSENKRTNAVQVNSLVSSPREICFRAGADVNRENETALIQAAKYGTESTVQLLLAAGILSPVMLGNYCSLITVCFCIIYLRMILV